MGIIFESENVLKNASVFDLNFSCSDMGNAERMMHYMNGDVKFCPTRKKWLFWTGNLWEWDFGHVIELMAKGCVRNIYKEAADTLDDERRNELVKWALKSESERAIKAMVELFKSEPHIIVELSELDTDTYQLNCLNGTIDLRNGVLQEPKKDDFITRIIPVKYDLDAVCPLWDKFLGQVTGGDEDLQDYIQRAIGYSLTADTSHQALFFLYGLGNNGKSTFLTTLRKLLGPYAQRAATDTFMMNDKYSGGPKESLADLVGKRFVTASELEDGKRLAVSLVKDLTGGETIKADRKYEHAFEFAPTFKIWLSGNHKPTITDTTLSIWRRVKLIPFTVTIPDNDIDPELSLKLENEFPGIFKWCIVGALKWRKDGLSEPSAVKNAVNQYRSDSDILHDFLEDCCNFGNDYSVTKAELRSKYEEWAKENHIDTVTQRTFKSRLIEKGFEEDREGNKRTRIWKGLRIADSCGQDEK